MTSFTSPLSLRRRIVISGISQGWCPGKGHASALETGIKAGHGCPARTRVCPEDRVLARPTGRLEAGCVWAPSVQKAQSTRAWLGNLTLWAGECPREAVTHLRLRHLI